MAYEQVVFDIPAKIQAGLASGELIRYGGIVRDASGHIVMHLKEVPVSKAKDALALARDFVKANPKLVLVGAAATLVLGGITVAISAEMRKAIETAENQLDRALTAYWQAVSDQNMNLQVVNELDTALANLRTLTGKQTSDFIDGAVLDSLIDYIRNFILHNAPTQLPEQQGGQVIDLEDYLRKQKRIIDEAS